MFTHMYPPTHTYIHTQPALHPLSFAAQVESNVLFRALRDFNIPKILSQDMVIFMGLLNDLFPGVDPPRKRDMEFEQVRTCAMPRHVPSSRETTHAFSCACLTCTLS